MLNSWRCQLNKNCPDRDVKTIISTFFIVIVIEVLAVGIEPLFFIPGLSFVFLAASFGFPVNLQREIEYKPFLVFSTNGPQYILL